MIKLVKILFPILFFGVIASAQSTTAATCSSNDVQNAINSVASGGTVNVPAGTCSWSGLVVNKAVSLVGTGIGKTNINLTGNNTITKQAGAIRISGFSFSIAHTVPLGFTVTGSWKNTQPVIIKNNNFATNADGCMNCGGLFLFQVVGGVIVSKNTFHGGWDGGLFQIKDSPDSQGSWTSADTLGTRDTNGLLNHYIEDNTFVGATNGGIDCDDGCRIVYRHNDLTNSSFNSHGEDTSPKGMRQFEVYGNSFKNTCSEGTDCSQIANENWGVWIRGGTGVIYNNYFDNLAGSGWGDKPEIKMNIRGAEDVRPQGTCSQVSYPVPHQLGQNNNGTNDFTDPIYIWGNTGTVGISAGWNWGNPCGFNFNTFFQWGRDGVNTGAARPSYTAYTYPHPLAGSSGGTTSGPTAPSGLQAVAK